MTEAKVQKCVACQASTDGPPKFTPLEPSKLPQRPWQEVSIDFLGPLPSGVLECKGGTPNILPGELFRS